MNVIEIVFEGTDLTIKSEKLKALGLRKGDKIQLRLLTPALVTANFSDEEIERRQAMLDETWGAWTEEEGAAAKRAIREMRAQWNPRDLS